MYHTMEALNKQIMAEDAGAPSTVTVEGKHPRRFEVLLNLTETIATVTIGAGFLLLVAACLAAV